MKNDKNKTIYNNLKNSNIKYKSNMNIKYKSNININKNKTYISDPYLYDPIYYEHRENIYSLYIPINTRGNAIWKKCISKDIHNIQKFRFVINYKKSDMGYLIMYDPGSNHEYKCIITSLGYLTYSFYSINISYFGYNYVDDVSSKHRKFNIYEFNGRELNIDENNMAIFTNNIGIKLSFS